MRGCLHAYVCVCTCVCKLLRNCQLAIVLDQIYPWKIGIKTVHKNMVEYLAKLFLSLEQARMENYALLLIENGMVAKKSLGRRNELWMSHC